MLFRFKSFRAILAFGLALGVSASRGILASNFSAAQGALDLKNQAVDPLKMAAGKVTVLVFLRTDCPVSNRYAPVIQAMSKRYEGKAVFWLVYPDKAESAEKIRQHDEEFGLQIPALRDVRHALVKLSHAEVTPEAAVFDAKQTLVYHGRIDNLFEDFGRSRREATTHELDDAIRAALEGKMPATASASAVGCYIADVE